MGDRELRVHGPSCAGGRFPATSPTETSPLCPAPAPTGGPTDPPWASGPLLLPGPVPLGKVSGTRDPVTINPVSRQNLPAHLFLEPEVAHPSSKGPVFGSQVLPRLSHPGPLGGGYTLHGGRVTSCFRASVGSGSLSSQPLPCRRCQSSFIPWAPAERRGAALGQGWTAGMEGGGESGRRCLGLLCFLFLPASWTLALGVFLWAPCWSPGDVQHQPRGSPITSSRKPLSAAYCGGCLPGFCPSRRVLSGPRGGGLEGLKCTTRQGVKHFLCPRLAVFRSTRPCRTACPWHSSRDRQEVEGTERDRRELEEVGGRQEKRKAADLAGGLPSKPVLGSWGFCHKPPPTRNRSCRAPSGAVEQGPSPRPPSFCTTLPCWHLLAYRNTPQFCLGPHTVFSLCARVRMSPFHKDTCPVGSGPTLMAPFPPDPLCKDTPP